MDNETTLNTYIKMSFSKTFKNGRNREWCGYLNPIFFLLIYVKSDLEMHNDMALKQDFSLCKIPHYCKNLKMTNDKLKGFFFIVLANFAKKKGGKGVVRHI
jgi:hypothetical protein